MKDYSLNGVKYVAVQAYKELINVYPFKYLANGDIAVDKALVLKLDKENVIDLISMDPRTFKTKNNVIGVVYYENLNKTITGFQALEFSQESGEFAKKPLWEIQDIKEPNVYRAVELSDGNLLVFAENNA